MKKVSMYRRNQEAKLTGMKERIVWLLSSGKMSGFGLAEKMGLPIRDVRQSLTPSKIEKYQKTVCIKYTDWYRNENGKLDRDYWIEGKISRITPSPKRGRTIVISKRSVAMSSDERKVECERRAKIRSRLIKAGLYISEMDID